MSQPLVSVYSISGSSQSETVPLPVVFKAPIRPDLIHEVFVKVNKNKRQAYAVSNMAGSQTSAESWGTGRAVSRIPRVGGGGTHRSGQGAFGNMCRGGRMFQPTKIWRKWHVKVNLNQKRYATVSAVAASSVNSLVLARGHRVENIPQVPLVVSNEFESISKTRDVVAAFKALGADKDVARVIKTRKIRAGKGKMRGRRFRQRRGPLIVYGNDSGIVKASRNIPGVETCDVRNLSLLQLAPGGHVGRFVIWTQGAFELIDSVWSEKSGFSLPTPMLANSDVTSLINSSEIQAVVKPAGPSHTRRAVTVKKNPLRNMQVQLRLNPYAKAFKAQKLGSVPAPKEDAKPIGSTLLASLRSD
ncbi:hypothetical protein CANCADRAFT_134368 [Tortispora caseinolytica NRRL Y-17796]|uniref:Large ribosomal subunit protein uL4 C-terminal domain-containing protein n=1 Tax=Tortispora caseinolytica NRRL Y-17796 TaxID=767744 RepID=A0A1E4TBY9_9ASCO|nr:hypothetical protein CANCADRAFT_134368 [Tortispora caseinolytica NRRL Y-17796]